MKRSLFAGCLLALFFLASCKHDSDADSENDFDFNKAAGIWVPYEYRQGDTLVFPGPFTTMGIFGAYSESVELKADKTFVPVIWFSASNIVKSEMEGGPAEYNKATKQLLLANPFGHKFTVKKFEGNQLWLDVTGGMYKFEKRQ